MTKIILGGGLSGLSASYYLAKSLPNAGNIVLLEASSRLGGWIKSEKVDKDVIFEQAPRTIRPGGIAGINTLNLLDELSLGLDVLPIRQSSPAAKNRLIYANNQLHILPNSLSGLIGTQKPFTRPLLNQVLNDLVAKPVKLDDDSAYEFAKRRFGSEVADYLIDTILCGICAGNSREISVKFFMKQMFAYEQKHGGVIKGVFKNLFRKKGQPPHAGVLAAKAKAEKWNVYTFNNGMETLPIALESQLRSLKSMDIQLNNPCKQIFFKDNSQATIHLENSKIIDCSHIISSISANQLAPLLQSQHPKLSTKLSKIKTVSVAVVNLLYKENLIDFPAFGLLVPPKERLPILGIIYDSCCRPCDNKTVLTVMMGGYWFSELFGDKPTEGTIFKIARDNLQVILGISAEPLQYKVNILRDCIPQYVVGHEKNLEEINCYIKENKLPLSLCGASYYGVGVNDVILSAKRVAEEVAQF